MFDPETLANNWVGAGAALVGILVAIGLIARGRSRKVAFTLLIMSIVTIALETILLPQSAETHGLAMDSWAIVLIIVAVCFFVPTLLTTNTKDYALGATQFLGTALMSYTMVVALKYTEYNLISVNIDIVFAGLTVLACASAALATYVAVWGFIQSRRAVRTQS